MDQNSQPILPPDYDVREEAEAVAEYLLEHPEDIPGWFYDKEDEDE